MSSALAAASNGGNKMPDLALEAPAASPTRSEEDEELNAAAAEAVRNLKSDDEDDEVVRGENGDNADLERKGLKDEIDAGENKEKQVSQILA